MIIETDKRNEFYCKDNCTEWVSNVTTYDITMCYMLHFFEEWLNCGLNHTEIILTLILHQVEVVMVIVCLNMVQQKQSIGLSRPSIS